MLLDSSLIRWLAEMVIYFIWISAVIGVETSHYIVFVKCGVGQDAAWYFFDSMAGRKEGRNGYRLYMEQCCDLH